jgi:hypothetical protein
MTLENTLIDLWVYEIIKIKNVTYIIKHSLLKKIVNINLKTYFCAS